MVVVKRGEESFEGGEEEEAELRLSSDFPPSLCRRSVGVFGLASASVRCRRGYARLVMEDVGLECAFTSWVVFP